MRRLEQSLVTDKQMDAVMNNWFKECERRDKAMLDMIGEV